MSTICTFLLLFVYGLVVAVMGAYAQFIIDQINRHETRDEYRNELAAAVKCIKAMSLNRYLNDHVRREVSDAQFARWCELLREDTNAELRAQADAVRF